jgi:SAM-dependent methyltransferase
MSTDIRDTVSSAYTDALERSRAGTGGCCGAKPCGTTASLAGYDAERDAYADAAQSSFGCGNPLAFAGVQPGQTVIDLGSGAGFDLLIAADKVGPSGRVIGVDMTDAMIEAARANAARAGKPNIDVRKGYIEKLPIDDAVADWVISNCVINLSPDKPAVFREIARVLRPGGRLSISDIMLEDAPAWLRTNAAAYSACVGGAISEAEYLAGLRDAGLVDVEVTERLVYDADQLRAMVHDELGAATVPADVVDRALAEVTGKVWSAKVVGRRG